MPNHLTSASGTFWGQNLLFKTELSWRPENKAIPNWGAEIQPATVPGWESALGGSCGEEGLVLTHKTEEQQETWPRHWRRQGKMASLLSVIKPQWLRIPLQSDCSKAEVSEWICPLFAMRLTAIEQRLLAVHSLTPLESWLTLSRRIWQDKSRVTLYRLPCHDCFQHSQCTWETPPTLANRLPQEVKTRESWESGRACPAHRFANWLAVTSVTQRREATKVKTSLADTWHLPTRPFPVQTRGEQQESTSSKVPPALIRGEPPVFKGLERILSDIVDFSFSLLPFVHLPN